MKKINYPKKMISHRIAEKLFVMEVIRDLDEAIDLICEQMSDEEKLDPFAEDLCPYFGVLWPAALGLSRHLENYPGLIRGKKILELGSGLGLPSMVAMYLGGQVITTDFHPDVEEYFLRNCRHSGLEGHFKRLNWREENQQMERFDVVMGSDILYESQHPEEVAQGLLRFLKKDGKIILADPGRNYLDHFLKASTKLGLSYQEWTYEAEDKQIKVLELSEEVG
jgi:predicted nicotinamide N-methyase